MEPETRFRGSPESGNGGRRRLNFRREIRGGVWRSFVVFCVSATMSVSGCLLQLKLYEQRPVALIVVP